MRLILAAAVTLAFTGGAALAAPMHHPVKSKMHMSHGMHMAHGMHGGMHMARGGRVAGQRPLDVGPNTPAANAAYQGGGVVLQGAPGAPAPTPMATPPGQMPANAVPQ